MFDAVRATFVELFGNLAALVEEHPVTKVSGKDLLARGVAGMQAHRGSRGSGGPDQRPTSGFGPSGRPFAG